MSKMKMAESPSKIRIRGFLSMEWAKLAANKAHVASPLSTSIESSLIDEAAIISPLSLLMVAATTGKKFPHCSIKVSFESTWWRRLPLTIMGGIIVPGLIVQLNREVNVFLDVLDAHNLAVMDYFVS